MVDIIPENTGDESNSKQRFVTRVFHEKDNQVIGAEVIVYDDEQHKIDSIVIADKTSLEEFENKWENISKYYVVRGDVALPDDIQAKIDSGDIVTLQDIIANRESSNSINATTLNEHFTWESFSLKDHDHNDKYCVTNHQSTNPTYGIATSSMYGHTKIVDNLNDSTFKEGTALSSRQGYELSQRIKDVNNRFQWSDTVHVGDYIKYRVNPDLRLCVCNYNRSNYTGLKSTTGKKELHGEGTIPKYYAPTARKITSLYRGDVTLFYNTDGSVNLYNLTKIDKINIHAHVMWHF